MQLINSFLDILLIIVVLGAGFLITLISAKALSLPSGRAILIYFWHTFFSFIYAWYTIEFYGDTIFYYRESQNGIDPFGFSTQSIVFIGSLIYEIFEISFLGMGFVFGMFGLIGLLIFDSSLRFITKNKSNNIKILATLFIFLPSVSFWSSGLGKDAVAFMAVNLVLWASLNLYNRKIPMIFGIIFMLLIRPHIAAVILIALTLSIFFERKINIINRVFLTIVVFITAYIVVNSALNYLNFNQDLNLQNIINYIKQRQEYNWKGFGGGTDIRSMSLPMQILNYLFKPLPYEANSIRSMLASIDNIFLLYLFIIGLYSKFKGSSVHPNINLIFFMIYGFGLLVILSMTTANTGIALRQKWMVLPFLIVLFFSFIPNKKNSIIVK